jgi:hypothetical protein
MPFKPALLSYQTACGGDAREAVKALIVANPFSRNRAGEITGCGLDRLCARDAAA